MSELKDSITDYLYFYKSSCPPPAILHVSQESRSEGLKYYKLDFAVQHKVRCKALPVTVTIPPTIYFNWMIDRLCIVDPSRVATVDSTGAGMTKKQAEHLGLLCEKRELRYLGYNCEEFGRYWYIFPGVIDRAVWLREIALFEVAFPKDKSRFSPNFNKHICPQGDCRCVAMKWKWKTYVVERLWKKQEERSNEKASLRFGRLTWTSKERKGSVDG
jgi:hypothetical protein